MMEVATRRPVDVGHAGRVRERQAGARVGVGRVERRPDHTAPAWWRRDALGDLGLHVRPHGVREGVLREPEGIDTHGRSHGTADAPVRRVVPRVRGPEDGEVAGGREGAQRSDDQRQQD